MQFIRQNLFLVALTAVLVVGVLVAVLAGSSMSPGKEWARRLEVSASLQQIGNSSLINSESLKKAEEEARQAKQGALDARRKAIEWNRRNFQVPELSAVVNGQTIKVAAFPFDKQLFDDNALYHALTKYYLDEIEAMRQSLRPTTAPTPEEFQAVEARTRAAEQPGAGGPAAPMGAWEDDIVFRDMTGLADGVPAPSLLEQKVRAASEGLRMDRARRGALYIELNAFHKVFPQPVDSSLLAQPERLWAGLVSLWVQKDIVAAINETNKQVAPAGQGPLTVPQAAVKHLVKIEVREMYIRSPGVTPGEALTHTEYVAPAAGYDEGAYFEDGPAPVAVPSAGPVGEGGNLTGRACTRDYDVVYYNFRVVMPTRHVLALERNLLHRNYHTIRKVQMTVPEWLRPAAGGIGEGGLISGHYYGEDAVMEVTIWGELLLLTSWTRGTWDAEKQQWSAQLPPLLPPQVLQTQIPQDALREEDQGRLPSGTRSDVYPN